MPTPQPSIESLKILARFSLQSPEMLQNWEEKIFKNKTAYEIFSENGRSFLKATSQNSSSGLFMKVQYDVTPELVLSWRWKALAFPKKKDPDKLSNRREDDFAARIYVVFPGSTLFKTNVIEYLWDENLPVGTLANSPFSERIKLVVIQSGAPKDREGGWQTEERNIYEDYLHFFGKPPDRPLGAIALMSDSDNTGTEAGSYFDEIELKLKKKEPPHHEEKKSMVD